MDPAAGIEVGIGWIEAEARIAVGGMIGVTVLTVVVAEAVTTAVDEMIAAVVATVGAIAKRVLGLFRSGLPSILFKS